MRFQALFWFKGPVLPAEGKKMDEYSAFSQFWGGDHLNLPLVFWRMELGFCPVSRLKSARKVRSW
jgi:hypothetical protein